jgi:hypothetical protein
VSAPLLSCRGTHSDYDRQGYSFRLAGQTVDSATITEVITLPVRHHRDYHGWDHRLVPAILEFSHQRHYAYLATSLRS